MPKFCGNCGTQLTHNANFCTVCGWASQQVLPTIQPQQDTAPKLRAEGNGAYVAWFLFYFILFSVATLGIAIPFYVITVILAFTPIAEKLWRWVTGVRPLRLHSEKERLLPLFKEVYIGAYEANPKLSKGIKLYIKEDMSINAFAFGKSTLILTRGSLELLNDDCLKGLIAHEFGHFSHRHTEAILLARVSNFYVSFIISKLTDLKNRLDLESKAGIANGFLKWIVDIIYYLWKATDFIGELIVMHRSRENEYLADGRCHEVNMLKSLVDKYHIAILLIHHLIKQTDDDSAERRRLFLVGLSLGGDRKVKTFMAALRVLVNHIDEM